MFICNAFSGKLLAGSNAHNGGPLTTGSKPPFLEAQRYAKTTEGQGKDCDSYAKLKLLKGDRCLPWPMAIGHIDGKCLYANYIKELI
jgi:hypothetical protein